MGARYSSSKMNPDRHPGGPVAETQHSECRGPGFDPMVRELRPGTTKEINLELKKKTTHYFMSDLGVACWQQVSADFWSPNPKSSIWFPPTPYSLGGD